MTGTSRTRLSRRTIIRTTGAGVGVGALTLASHHVARAQDSTPTAGGTPSAGGTSAALATTYPFTLPKLPYAYDALEPITSATTQKLHHDGLHGNYVKNLNAALQDVPDAQGFTLEELLQNVAAVPTDDFTDGEGVTKPRQDVVLSNAGGHYNHSVWWDSMSPDGGGEPTGTLANAITSAFGDFDSFKTAMKLGALGNTGSGWTWLLADQAGALSVFVTTDQNNPLASGNGYPVFGIDNWEHSYLLDYTAASGRGDWINAFWKIVDWSFIGPRYDAFIGS